MRAVRFGGGDEVSIREGAEEFAEGARGFEGLPAEGVAAGNEGKLMDGAVGAEDGPASAADPAMDLREALAAVEGLIVPAMGMAEARVDFVEAHEIEIVGSGEEKTATGASDAKHFAEGVLNAGKMLDGFAGDDNIEGVAGEGEVLRIALDERSGWRQAVVAKL